jgi:hypothetical protein
MSIFMVIVCSFHRIFFIIRIYFLYHRYAAFAKKWSRSDVRPSIGWKVVSQKIFKLEEPVLKVILELIIIWYNPTYAQTRTLNKPPRKTLKSYLLLEFTSIFSIILCQAPEKQDEQSIRAQFFFRSIFVIIFVSFFFVQFSL